MSDKLSTFDLVMTVIKEHEKKLDQLVHNLEEIVKRFENEGKE